MKYLPSVVKDIVWMKVATGSLSKIRHLMEFAVTGLREREVIDCFLVPPSSTKVGTSPLRKYLS